jgi:Flp pilus assembly protein TadD
VCVAASFSPVAPAQSVSDSGQISNIVSSLRSQNFDQALQLCSTALDKTHMDKRIWSLCGMAHSGRGETTSALEAYEAALKLDPVYLPALEGAAQIEYQRGGPGARELILRVLGQRPEDATSHTMLGVLDFREKNCTEAVRHFERGGEVLARQPAVLADYGTCLAQTGHVDRAVAVFQQALEVDPENPNSRFNLSLAQWKLNRPQDALATLQPMIGAGEAHDDALLLAADIYESTGDSQHAVELLRKGILANPKNADAYLDFAALSYDHSSIQVGIDILNLGLTQLPREARLYLVRGILYVQLGRVNTISI